MRVRITRAKQYKRIPLPEFEITKQFMDLLGIECGDNYTIVVEDCYEPISIGGKLLAFTERYSSIQDIPRDMVIFRPMTNDKHANILIRMFEMLDYIEYDTLDITEYTKDGKIKYSGRLIKNGKVVEGSYIKTSPSIALLKMSIIAAILMDADEHKQYMQNLLLFLKKDGR